MFTGSISTYCMLVGLAWIAILLASAPHCSHASETDNDVLFTIKRFRSNNCRENNKAQRQGQERGRRQVQGQGQGQGDGQNQGQTQSPLEVQQAHIQMKKSAWLSLMGCLSQFTNCRMKLIGVPNREITYLFTFSPAVSHSNNVLEPRAEQETSTTCWLPAIIFDSEPTICQTRNSTSISDMLHVHEQFQVTWGSNCKMRVCLNSINITTEKCDTINQVAEEGSESNCTMSKKASPQTCSLRCHEITTTSCVAMKPKFTIASNDDVTQEIDEITQTPINEATLRSTDDTASTSSNNIPTTTVAQNATPDTKKVTADNDDDANLTLIAILAVLLPLIMVGLLVLIAVLWIWRRKRTNSQKRQGREQSSQYSHDMGILTPVERKGNFYDNSTPTRGNNASSRDINDKSRRISESLTEYTTISDSDIQDNVSNGVHASNVDDYALCQTVDYSQIQEVSPVQKLSSIPESVTFTSENGRNPYSLGQVDKDPMDDYSVTEDETPHDGVSLTEGSVSITELDQYDTPKEVDKGVLRNSLARPEADKNDSEALAENEFVENKEEPLTDESPPSAVNVHDLPMDENFDYSLAQPSKDEQSDFSVPFDLNREESPSAIDISSRESININYAQLGEHSKRQENPYNALLKPKEDPALRRPLSLDTSSIDYSQLGEHTKRQENPYNALLKPKEDPSTRKPLPIETSSVDYVDILEPGKQRDNSFNALLMPMEDPTTRESLPYNESNTDYAELGEQIKRQDNPYNTLLKPKENPSFRQPLPLPAT